MKKGQDYPAIAKGIEGLGTAVKLEYSFYFVLSNLTAEQAMNRLSNFVDANDKLVVVDAKSNNGYWRNLDPSASEALKRLWK